MCNGESSNGLDRNQHFPSCNFDNLVADSCAANEAREKKKTN